MVRATRLVWSIRQNRDICSIILPSSPFLICFRDIHISTQVLTAKNINVFVANIFLCLVLLLVPRGAPWTDIYSEKDRNDLTALTQRCQNKLLPFPLLPMRVLTYLCMHAHAHTQTKTKQTILLIISRD